MSRPLRDLALLASLALLSALFAAVIAGVDRPPPPLAAAPPPPSAPSEPPALPQVEPVPLERLSVALQRPLFYESRRPPAAPAAAPRPLDATLAGVLRTEAEKVAIVMAEGGSGRASRLREGDTFRGWQVVRIDDRSVEFERDGRTERLTLSFTEGTPAPPAPDPDAEGRE